MRNKILLLDHYTKIGCEALPVQLARMDYIVDKLFKSNPEEVLGIIKRGNYKALIINIINKAVLDVAKLVRAENSELPIIGISTNEKEQGDYSPFTEVLSQPIDFEKIKSILKGELSNE